MKYYVGHKLGLNAEVFRADNPTSESHPQYNYVTGPFRTKRGATWATQYGCYFYSIAEAERLALLSQTQSELCRAYDKHLQTQLDHKRRGA